MLKFSYDASRNLASEALENVSPPQIIGQPVEQVVEPGEAATFSVVISDARGVGFHWRFNGTDIPGATGDSFLLTDVSAADKGQYSVVVTNSVGSVTSASASLILTTDPPSNLPLLPVLTAYSDAGGSVTVAPMKLGYELGETVTLKATPFPPSVFVGWVGDLNDTANPASLTMDGNKTVRARFASAVGLPPGLVAFWRGETDASDLIGGHDGAFFAGTSSTAPSVTPSGKVGGAFDFDGTVHVRVPDSDALRPAQITLEAWIFPHELPTDNAHRTVIARGAATDDSDAWYLGVFNALPEFITRQEVRAIHSVTDVILRPFVELSAKQWTHLAATFDGSTKRLYVNGAEVGAQGGLGALVYAPAAVPVTIGSDLDFNASASRFNGRVDEVAIYNRALTANEVFDIYDADRLGKIVTQPYFTTPSPLSNVVLLASYIQQLTTILGKAPVSFSLSAGALPPGMALSSAGSVSGIPSTAAIFDFTVRATDAAGLFTEQLFTLHVCDSVTAPAGLVGWWRAEGNALDSAGANHGALRNGAGFAPGEVAQAFSLDGTDDCVEIPDAPALRPGSVTLEAWVAFDKPTDVQVIFAKPVGAGSGDSYALWLDSGTLKGTICDAAGDVNASDFIIASFALVPGRWCHVAYTFDDGVKQQRLYIDGIQVAIGTVTKSIGYDAQPLLLGRDTEVGTPMFFLQGRIDEAAIYNRALSGHEIASIYDAGPAGKRLV